MQHLPKENTMKILKIFSTLSFLTIAGFLAFAAMRPNTFRIERVEQ